jgi:hypothetical protein
MLRSVGCLADHHIRDKKVVSVFCAFSLYFSFSIPKKAIQSVAHIHAYGQMGLNGIKALGFY